ncbi:MAG: DEAD/DEAH box helicase [Nitrospira sp. SB0666_bin_27]|nr:DEAD/DEAH box helicase [Nitrospira sp. SB0666_bin_27]MYF24526.1 DEAD/DEAH box helicase [Nitrospira sp. SB0678_bin_10]
METVEELVDFLERALDGRARGRVVDTGEAWSIVRRAGVIPDEAPDFRQTLDADLAEYGFALLDAGLALNALERGHTLARRAFETSGRTFENLVRNGDLEDPQRGFHRVMAAAAYHLGSYAAIAYALLRPVDAEDQNLNTAEICLVRLMLRDLGGVQKTARAWLLDDRHQDNAISERLQGPDDDRDAELALILISCVCRALATFEFALRIGVSDFVVESREILSDALALAAEAGMSSLWWVIRLTLGLLDDLWKQSLHMVIPSNPPEGALDTYADMRTVFIASLFARDLAEVELWPSQIDAARRAVDPADDLVVALPTSAGKTRIAELATLTALAMAKRVLIVTPLRALSAQSERSFRSRFAPLGATVSSLYGMSGLSGGDADALRSHNIVVSTPEKLDFALRNDPTIIADVGLIVLDEGHMIGPGKREIDYEVLVQRLLRRADAHGRRIVCLSAVLPDGEQLRDMTAWIRSDEEGEHVRSDWRPTRQRYGTLEWRGQTGRLNYDLDDDGPFVSRFIRRLPPRGRDKNPYPRDLRDVVLMGAWRFAEEGKRTLIFITQANRVNGYGERAFHLVEKGYLPALLEEPEAVEEAVSIGVEWLGPDHPAVRCLRYGIAVHHGKLPSPFLREVERLLASGKIKITAASPTLAQGLNLNAAALLIPSIFRQGERISGEELANVAGRAGRAFVDTEGLVLHVMYDGHGWRRNRWRELVNEGHARSIMSGLIKIIDEVIRRLAKKGIEGAEGYEYLANAREAWLEDADESDEKALEALVAKADSIILGLVEALDSDAADLPALLEEALSGSLWERQLEREDPRERTRQMCVLTARAKLIWKKTTASERRGYFAMGVGLETGLQVDEMADVLAGELDRAELAALRGDKDELYGALVRLGTRLLGIRPFAPRTLDKDWFVVLRDWIGGGSLSVIGSDHVGLIEDVFMYRLVWALEAVRVRRVSHGWEPEIGTIPGAAAACVETGLPDYRMTLLIRGGLASREAAQTVVNALEPEFLDGSGMRLWLSSRIVAEWSEREDWPTASTRVLWRRFRGEALRNKERAWRSYSENFEISELDDAELRDGALVRLEPDLEGGGTWLRGPDFRKIGRLEESIEARPDSVVYAEVYPGARVARVRRIGPDIRAGMV